MTAALGVGGIFYYSWVIPFGLLTLVVGASYLGFLRALPARIRMLFVVAAVLYVGGALGLELIQGYVMDYIGSANAPVLMVMLTHTEELCEMLGVATFAYALLCYLREHVGRVALAFEPARPTIETGDGSLPLSTSPALETRAGVAGSRSTDSR